EVMQKIDRRQREIDGAASLSAVGAQPLAAVEVEGTFRLARGRVFASSAFAPGALARQLVLVTLVLDADSGVCFGPAPVVTDELIALPLVPDVVGWRGREAPGGRGRRRFVAL